MYKQDLLFCYKQETHLNFKDEQKTGVKDGEIDSK